MFLITFSTSILAQQESKISYETGVGIAWEGNYGLIGLNQYNTLSYNLKQNFSISGNLGFFQSINPPNEFNNNISSMLFDLNINYSILNRNKNSLIFGAGVSYFKGALAYDDGTLSNPRHDVTCF